MRKIFFFLLMAFCLKAQTFYSDNPLAHTYSIVARDPATGEMGVAVQSHWFSVGTIVSWAEAGVGAIATQSFVNPAFGPEGSKLLKEGYNAKEALDILIKADEGREFRQLAIIDAQGNAAAYTGSKCILEAGHYEGDQFSVQANLMRSAEVWPAMKKAYENAEGTLAEKLLTALDAAEAEGGDIRGKQSAALLIVKSESSGKVWEDRLIDLHVEDHPKPLKELRRLYKVHQAYEFMNAGDVAVEQGNMELAMQKYSAAQEMFPENLEMKYWTAVTLANTGQLDKALPIFKEVFEGDKSWETLTPRLIKNKMLTVPEEDLQKILSVTE